MLHDGDLVEVDADHGVVRILERAEAGLDDTTPSQRTSQIEWHKEGLWETPFFQDYMMVDCTKAVRSMGFPFDFREYLYADGEIYISERDFQTACEYHRRSYAREGLSYFERFEREVVRYASEAISFSQPLKHASFDKQTNGHVRKLLQEFSEKIVPNIALAYLLRSIDQVLEETLEEKLYPHIASTSIEEQQRVLAIVTSPSWPSTITKERKEILALAKEIQNDEKKRQLFQEVSPEGILEYFRKNDVILYEKVVRHADTYGWMSNYNWDQRVSTPTDYIRNVASLVDSDADAALTEIEENYRALEVKYLAFADTLKSDEVVSLCDLVRRFVNRKLENWEAIAMAGNNALPLFHDVCRRLGISIEQFFLLSGPEIQKSLKTSMDDTEAVNSPKRGILIVEKKVSILKYEEAVELKKALQKKTNGDIRGKVVFHGTKTGPVRVIMNVGELSKMKKGDILVCPMTNPDYIPAVHLAGAIVTDEGGILCHAAIISREFQIPCIIGTKVATQVLHDGDLVEVDADHGVVRVLERVNSNS